MGSASQLQLGSHSTSEQATRHKWVDGRVIYSRTFTGTITIGASTRDATSIAAAAGLQIVDARGYFNTGAGRQYPLFSNWRNGADSSTTSSSGMFYDSATGSITLVTLADVARSASPYALTIWYIK